MPLLNGLQPMHLLLVLVVVVVVFGPSKLPELGASLGKGIREFKRTTEDFNDAKESVTSAISLEPTRRTVVSAPVVAAAPLPTQPEPRHEPVVLARQEID
jgi:sec-independent protein translocase protein TatA